MPGNIRRRPELTTHILSPLVRVKGSEVIKKVLESWSAEAIVKGEAAMEKAIKAGLIDATPAVRENSRASFWLYASHFPGRLPLYPSLLFLSLFTMSFIFILFITIIIFSQSPQVCRRRHLETLGKEQAKRYCADCRH